MARIRVLLSTFMAAAVAVAISCGGGGGGGSSPTEPAGPRTVTVRVTDFSYDPRSITINPGDTVRWLLQGSDTTHTVTALDGSFDSGTVFTKAGDTFERRFTQENVTHNYSCKAHSDCCNMRGSIRVGEAAPPPNAGYE